MSDRDDWKFWTALASSLSPAIATAFLDVIDRLEKRFTTKDIVNALESGDLKPFLDEVVTAPELQEFIAPVQAAIVQAAEAQVKQLPELTISFDAYNQSTVDAVQRQSARLITEVTDEIKSTIRYILEAGEKSGASSSSMAAEIRQYIGLTQKGATAIQNYRRMLEEQDPTALERALRDKRFDRSLINSINGGPKLSPAQIDKQVEAMRKKALTYRARLISDNETLQAVQEGQRATWRQVLADKSTGVIGVVRRWFVAHDERLCPICAPVPDMNEKGRGMDENFETPIGPVIGPLLHIKCRCITLYRALYA